MNAASAAQAPRSAELWYRQPAAGWNEALPLGSGSLGMMVFGGTDREELQLNEESLWSGCPTDWDNPACRKALPELRRLLFSGKNAEAAALARRTLVCLGSGSDDPRFGSYQTAGSLLLERPEADCSAYRRSLELYTGTAETAFGTVKRVHTLSHRHQVTASRCTGGVGAYRLTFVRENAQIAYTPEGIFVRGQQEGEGALSFCTVVQAETDSTICADTNALTIAGGTGLTLWTCTATSYWGEDPEAVCLERLRTARSLGFAAVLADEQAWVREAMERCTLALPGSTQLAALPTDERLARVRNGETDLGLLRIYFDFGRYLLIGSAGGRLPANLQGVWSKDLSTPWNGDYHANINLQMNYWPVDALGLSEYAVPLYRYIAFAAQHGARTARVMYGCGGWVTHTLGTPWGFTAPGQDPAWGSFHCGGAWLCRHLWEHYLYTGDRTFLRTYWPVLWGSAAFFRDFLVEDPRTGYLVTAPSNSPENSYVSPDTGEKIALCAGPTMDSMIIRELFSNTLSAATALGERDELTDALPGLLAKLPPVRVSKRYAIVQEWQEDYEEWEPGHRHISQLYGLYPGTEISPEYTPELAQAAERTLERRLSHGGGHTGWSRAWIINFYARLWNGAEAAKHLQLLLAKSTLPNLFDSHPPFQIDGNFGAVAGILEMLVQSHEDGIRLLPALPPDWSDGALNGVRVRGGFTLSFRWQAGQITEGTISSQTVGTARIYLNGAEYSLPLRPGELLPLPGAENQSGGKS